jgi:hypothetical protein
VRDTWLARISDVADQVIGGQMTTAEGLTEIERLLTAGIDANTALGGDDGEDVPTTSEGVRRWLTAHPGDVTLAALREQRPRTGPRQSAAVDRIPTDPQALARCLFS